MKLRKKNLTCEPQKSPKIFKNTDFILIPNFFAFHSLLTCFAHGNEETTANAHKNNSSLWNEWNFSSVLASFHILLLFLFIAIQFNLPHLVFIHSTSSLTCLMRLNIFYPLVDFPSHVHVILYNLWRNESTREMEVQ